MKDFFPWRILHFSTVSRMTYKVTLIKKTFKSTQKGLNRKTLIRNERKKANKILQLN